VLRIGETRAAIRIGVFVLTLTFALGASACGSDSSRVAEEAPTVSPASDLEGVDCRDDEFSAILPHSQELQDSLTAVAAAASLQDLAALTDAGGRVVTAGFDLQTVVRDTSPCSPRLKKARKLVTEAGASAVYSGLEIQEAAELMSGGNTAAALPTIRQLETDLAALASKAAEAAQLITGESDSNAEPLEVDTSPWGKSATGSDWGFMTPSQNIVCNSDEDAFRCVVFSDATPDGQKAWTLSVSGRPTVAIVQANVGTDVPTLGYGRAWKRGRYSCISRRAGLTCQNHDGHGFELSRERRRVF
jgi:hypothetical protein